MKRFLAVVALLVSLFSAKAESCTGKDLFASYAPDGIPFVVSDSLWTVDGFGNHRAVVQVKGNSRAVRVVMPWRRPDLRVETKSLKIVDVEGRQVKNILVEEINAERGVVLFEPISGPGIYHIYYMPFRFRKKYDDARFGEPWNDYFPPVYDPDQEWLQMTAQAKNAQVLRFEERSEFDAFTSMGNIATAAETERIRKSGKARMMLFPEDRVFQIRLQKQLPVRWVERGPSLKFKGTACLNEYYTWQIGIWAHKQALNHVRLEFSDLRCGSDIIPADSMTCFNLEGVNWDGTSMKMDLDVPYDHIQALWCGMQIPRDAVPGTYRGSVTVSADGIAPQEVQLCIKVLPELLEDKGDSQLWRMSRLRWLNSQIGCSDAPTKGYDEIKIKENVITATDKRISLSKNGLPASIMVNGREVLSQPMQFVVRTSEGDINFPLSEFKMKKCTSGSVSWESSGVNGGVGFVCNATAEFDGYIHYEVEVSSDTEMTVEDVFLQSDFSQYSSTYFMGAGHDGGRCPENHVWKWNGCWDSFWMGGAEAGLRIEFRGGSYNGPLIKDYKPVLPESWYNRGSGYVAVNRGETACVKAGSGMRRLTSDTLSFEFDLQITPAKPVDTFKHFNEKYCHGSHSRFEDAKANGATVLNLHHSTPLNPVINYPFVVRDELKSYVDRQHLDGAKVKLYYTVRELSNYTHEIYALNSLGGEIFPSGRGYGAPWHQEHLVDGYSPAWYTELPEQNADAALILAPFSRWINYYLEGLRWMLVNYGIDGIYMDDVAFDRPVMKRLRRIMDQYSDGSLIDLHSCNIYSIGAAQQYVGFYPYIDSVWYGEHFWYNQLTSDQWFVSASGIPFGVMADMLQDGGNRWLGMLFGSTTRYNYGPCDPSPIWKFWSDYRIDQAEMVGFWDEHPLVSTAHPEVKVTSYAHEDMIIMAVGNFTSEMQDIRLDIDWSQIPFDKESAAFFVPEIKDYQSAMEMNPDSVLRIDAKKGLLIVVRK